MNDFQTWHGEISVLRDLRTDWNDNLEVIDGRLHLEKGTRFRMGQPITQNPSELASHLESLISTGNQCFESLQSVKSDDPVYFEKVADFKREFKCLTKSISNLKGTFSSDKKNYAYCFIDLDDLGNSFLKKIKNYKSTLKRPPLSERPIKHIIYDERTELTSIKWSYPKRVPLKETVAAAKKALSLSRYTLYDYFRFPLAPLMYITSIILTAFKIVLWDPFEWLIYGKITTSSPYLLFSDSFKNHNSHEKAYQKFARQILHCSIITEEVATAFEELAPHATTLNLDYANLAAENPEELKPFIRENKALPIVDFLEVFKQKSQKLNTSPIICLQDLKGVYERAIYFIIEPEQKKNPNGLSSKELLKNCGNFSWLFVSHLSRVDPLITPKVLERLFKAATSSKTCDKIVLSSELDKLPFVKDFLTKNSYSLTRIVRHPEIHFNRRIMEYHRS